MSDEMTLDRDARFARRILELERKEAAAIRGMRRVGLLFAFTVIGFIAYVLSVA